MKWVNRFFVAMTVLVLVAYAGILIVTGVTQRRAGKECRAMGYIGATAFGTWASCVVQYRSDSTVTLTYARRRGGK